MTWCGLPLRDTDALDWAGENSARHSGGHAVSVRARAVGERVRVRIVDRGPGIPATQLAPASPRRSSPRPEATAAALERALRTRAFAWCTLNPRPIYADQEEFIRVPLSRECVPPAS